MMLLTKEIRAKLPGIGTQDGKPPSQVPVVAKFFTPDGNWTWYATEFDGQDEFFGLVAGFETELGYFSLSELQSLRGRLGLPVERDRGFSATLRDVLVQHGEAGLADALERRGSAAETAGA